MQSEKVWHATSLLRCQVWLDELQSNPALADADQHQGFLEPKHHLIACPLSFSYSLGCQLHKLPGGLRILDPEPNPTTKWPPR